MPLVRIDLIRGKPREYRLAIVKGVHRALVEAVGIPVDDRFHVVSEHEKDNLVYDKGYLGIDRTDDIVFIQVALRRGRTPEARLRLYRLITENLSRDPGIRTEDVLITLVENDPVDWSVGKGEAQLLEFLPAQIPPGVIDLSSCGVPDDHRRTR